MNAISIDAIEGAKKTILSVYRNDKNLAEEQKEVLFEAWRLLEILYRETKRQQRSNWK